MYTVQAHAHTHRHAHTHIQSNTLYCKLSHLYCNNHLQYNKKLLKALNFKMNIVSAKKNEVVSGLGKEHFNKKSCSGW